MPRLLLGVSGGIAAYKALEMVRLVVRARYAVRLIQTPTSERFVGRASFEALTGAPVLISEFEPDPARGSYPGETVPPWAPISHLALVARADLYLIAPASANTIAKLAHGQADNLLTTASLAAACPVAVAPAMNDRMYRHAATQANLALLSARGVTIVEPQEGELASRGEHGLGRLAEPATLLAVCEALLAAPPGERRDGMLAERTGALAREPSPWTGLRVLVSAGGTREPIDSVRFVGNHSSGRMGVALAAQALGRGADVTLVAANVTVSPPPGVRVIEVRTAAELAQACEREFPACDVLLMAAAVADFRPRRAADGKLGKDAGTPTIELEPTPDVLRGLAGRRRPGQLLVGFAAEHGVGAVERGRAKLERKRLDAVVVNDISRPGIGFDAPENEVTILTLNGSERLVAQASKGEIADAVLDEVEQLRSRMARTGVGARDDARSGATV
ncbi:MAG: bifunctional phosphopantothenoylcysteine decarboxylase/phosphopantothenate--cysteine ligase CoaBC [Solirubrobacteraceae bacterium]